MATRIPSPKHPIHKSAVIPLRQAQPNSRVTLPRFSGKDTVTTTASLPEWTKDVKDPTMTMAQFGQNVEDLSKKYSSEGKEVSSWSAIKIVFQLLPSGFKLWRASKKTSNYLPEKARKDLRRYHWTPSYWYNRLFNSQKANLMDIVYMGPLAIKAKQAEITYLSVNKQNLENAVKTLKNSNQPGILKHIKLWANNRQLKTLATYAPLLNQVPALPYKLFENQLKELETTYNASHTNDPIQTIEKKAIKGGSIGQVHTAKTKSGQIVVLKMVKPDLTESYLNGYRPYLYYARLLAKGTTSEQKHSASSAAQESVDILTKEAHPESEAMNTRKMREWATKLGPLPFEIPNVLTYTKDGLALPFVGDKDFAELSTDEQLRLKSEISPSLAKFLLLSSAKPLDIHDGNMRSGKNGEPVQWIDHGRQFNVNDASNQKMLHLLTTSLAVKKDPGLSHWKSLALQPSVQVKLKELLEIAPVANQKALQNLGNLVSLGNVTEQAKKLNDLQNRLRINNYRKQWLKDDPNQNGVQSMLLSPEDEAKLNSELQPLLTSLQPYTETVKLLKQLLGEPDTSDPKSPSLSRKVIDAKLQDDRYVEPAVLNAWASCAQNLPGFAEHKLPVEDIRYYQKKMKGFIAPYLEELINVSPTVTRTQKNDQKLDALTQTVSEALIDATNSQFSPPEKEQLRLNIKNSLEREL